MQGLEIIDLLERVEIQGAQNGTERAGARFPEGRFQAAQPTLGCLHVPQYLLQQGWILNVAGVPHAGNRLQHSTIQTFA